MISTVRIRGAMKINIIFQLADLRCRRPLRKHGVWFFHYDVFERDHKHRPQLGEGGEYHIVVKV